MTSPLTGREIRIQLALLKPDGSWVISREHKCDYWYAVPGKPRIAARYSLLAGLFEFNTDTGRGYGQAAKWRIHPDDLNKARQEVRDHGGRVRPKPPKPPRENKNRESKIKSDPRQLKLLE